MKMGYKKDFNSHIQNMIFQMANKNGNGLNFISNYRNSV